MNIDESKILNPDYYDEQKALACLLASDICFLNVKNVGTKEKPEWTTVVYVNANDIFAWGCSDAESITNNDGEADSEIIALYKCWKENPNWGFAKWLCFKRNEQPQNPVKDLMIKNNCWDETLEALPENYYDMKRRELSKK